MRSVEPDLAAPRALLRLATAGLLVAVVSAMALFLPPEMQPRQMPDLEAGCETGLPYYVTACYRSQARQSSRPDGRGPSILLFADSPDGSAEQYSLALTAETGAVWGLAFRSQEPAVYASSFHKRSLPFGPGGPGAIYRIDLRTGEVATFVDVPNAGADRHDDVHRPLGDVRHDYKARDWVGRTSLGDLELSRDESELFVVNLNDRRIYRFGMPDGAMLGAFEHGAVAESWAADARPFGLAFEAGALYHGVLDETGRSFDAKVYRSRPDGSDMIEVASLDLNYGRERVRLQSLGTMLIDWYDWTPINKTRFRPRPNSLYSEPMLTDIEFTNEGDMVLALRDRRWDIESPWARVEVSGDDMRGSNIAEPMLGFGDLILARREGEHFLAQTRPEHFDDANALLHPESALGGLARAGHEGGLIATAFGVEDSSSRLILGQEGIYGFDAASGGKTGLESTCQAGRILPYADLLARPPFVAQAHDGEPTAGPPGPPPRVVTYVRDLGSMGDIEALCPVPPPSPTPTHTPTDTPTQRATSTPRPSPTPTASPTETTTAVPPTQTPTPSASPTARPGRIYLPLLLGERCDPELARTDAILILDASSSMAGAKIEAARQAGLRFLEVMRLPEDRVGVVAFSRSAQRVHGLSGDRGSLEAAIRGVLTAPGTRIDSGLAMARDMLESEGRGGTVSPVIVLLTDGIQEDLPDLPLSLAAELRAAGVTLYAVGLGADVDMDYLTQLAGDPSRLYRSPDPEDLAEIYAQIARRIPCPPERYWGRRS